CALDQLGSGNNGVVCRWKPANYAPSNQCTLPTTDEYVTQSACGWSDGVTGSTPTSLQSSSIKPNNNDWLFVEVTIPKVLNPVTLPTMISGCATWTQTPVFQQFINSDQGLAVWYMGQVQSGSTCNVTVTLAQANPAALKVYDVPKATGKIDVVVGASG